MSELEPETEALVRAGRDALRPAAADRDRIRAALRGRLTGSGSGEVGSPAPHAAAARLASPVRSALLFGVVLGGGALFYALRGGEPQRPATTPVVAAPAVSAVVPVMPSAAPSAPASSASAPTPAVSASVATLGEPRAPAPRSADRLAEEVAILSRAETELHAGRYANALRILDEHQRRFPHGTLAQERLAARIHALCGLGRVTEARAAMARLAPGSLHEGSVRDACAPSSK